MVIEVWPSTTTEVICATPAICANCRSSGCATEVAMVSGLAPGNLALTLMVGKFDPRQRRHRQQRIGGDADQQDRRHQQRGADRPADEGGRDAHARVAASCSCRRQLAGLGSVAATRDAVLQARHAVDDHPGAVVQPLERSPRSARRPGRARPAARRRWRPGFSTVDEQVGLAALHRDRGHRQGVLAAPRSAAAH